MSMNYEYMDAAHINTYFDMDYSEWCGEGGEPEVPALQLCTGDFMLIITGSPEKIKRMLENALEKIGDV